MVGINTLGVQHLRHSQLPYKSFQCNQDMNVSQLMQVINGAAMAKFWVFFEHLDNLPLVNF